MALTLNLVFLTMVLVTSMAQNEEQGCNCVCFKPNGVDSTTSTSERQTFYARVPPMKCNCESVVLPKIHGFLDAIDKGYCLQCECILQNWSSAYIELTVIMLVLVMSIVGAYMSCVECLAHDIFRLSTSFSDEEEDDIELNRINIQH